MRPHKAHRHTGDDLFIRALKSHRKGEVETADKLYQNVLALDPGHAEANHLLGRIRHDQGKLEQAQTLLERAASAD